jgi:SEC-C motif-containing protein
MRSRYSAFASGLPEYLLSTWDAATRPATLDLDPSIVWLSLEILGRTGGGMLDTTGTVEFVARYRVGPERGEQRENSRFRKSDGAWFYLGAAS